MANTIIKVKSSSVAGAVPTWSQLANGELAINFADGKLYYKNSTSNLISYIANGSTGSSLNFGTINVNSSLVVADADGDVLSLVSGSGITLTPVAANDTIIISATGGSGGGVYANISDSAPSDPSPGQMWWNSAVGQFFVYYNDGSSSQWVEATSVTIDSSYFETQVLVKSGNYTFSANDINKVINISSGDATVPNNIFTAGQSLTLFNNTAVSMNIVNAPAVMMYMAGTPEVGPRVLTQKGVASILFVGANTCVISGAGLS